MSTETNANEAQPKPEQRTVITLTRLGQAYGLAALVGDTDNTRRVLFALGNERGEIKDMTCAELFFLRAIIDKMCDIAIESSSWVPMAPQPSRQKSNPEKTEEKKS